MSKFRSIHFVIAAVILLGGLTIYGLLSSSQIFHTQSLSSGKYSTSSSAESITFATSSEPIQPKRLLIPKLGIDTEVEPVGIDVNGNMSAPVNWRNVSWYEPGFAPGDKGNAVFAGHLDWAGNTAVFWELDKLSAGDLIQINGDTGSLRYVVVLVEEIDYQLTDTASIFGPAASSQIKLITCDGNFISGDGTYEKRLVVTARLIASPDG